MYGKKSEVKVEGTKNPFIRREMSLKPERNCRKSGELPTASFGKMKGLIQV